MPDALRPADYPDAMVRVACRRCDRRGQYRRSSLIALYGERAALPDVLAQLAHDCPMRGGIGDEACGVYFPDLVERLLSRSPDALRPIVLHAVDRSARGSNENATVWRPQDQRQAPGTPQKAISRERDEAHGPAQHRGPGKVASGATETRPPSSGTAVPPCGENFS